MFVASTGKQEIRWVALQLGIKKHSCHHVKVVEAKLSFQLSSSLAVFAPIFLVHRGPAAQRPVPATAAQSRAARALQEATQLVNVADYEALWKQLMPISQYESDSSVAKKRHRASLVLQISRRAEIPMAKYTSKNSEIDLNWLQGAKKKKCNSSVKK